MASQRGNKGHVLRNELSCAASQEPTFIRVALAERLIMVRVLGIKTHSHMGFVGMAHREERASSVNKLCWSQPLSSSPPPLWGRAEAGSRCSQAGNGS